MENYLKQFSIFHFQFPIEESRVQFFAPIIFVKILKGGNRLRFSHPTTI